MVFCGILKVFRFVLWYSEGVSWCFAVFSKCFVVFCGILKVFRGVLWYSESVSWCFVVF